MNKCILESRIRLKGLIRVCDPGASRLDYERCPWGPCFSSLCQQHGSLDCRDHYSCKCCRCQNLIEESPGRFGCSEYIGLTADHHIYLNSRSIRDFACPAFVPKAA